jgi:5'-3' exonuclease
MKEAFSELGCQFASAPGYEADDVAGSLCAMNSFDECVLMTRDKDWMQLVSDGRVSIWHENTWTHEQEVFLKFGVGPKLITDVIGLSGDSGDGIPGVPGIGAKIASSLVAKFGALESLYDSLFLIRGNFRSADRIIATLRQSKDAAFMSRTLATIKTDVDLRNE